MNMQRLYHFAENHNQLIENYERLQGIPGVKYISHSVILRYDLSRERHLS